MIELTERERGRRDERLERYGEPGEQRQSEERLTKGWLSRVQWSRAAGRTHSTCACDMVRVRQGGREATDERTGGEGAASIVRFILVLPSCAATGDGDGRENESVHRVAGIETRVCVNGG